MMRALLAVCCLVGLVLGGAFVPALGIQTPIPDLGAEDGDAGSGGELGLGEPGDGSDSGLGDEPGGDSGLGDEPGGDADNGAGETPEGTASGVDGYGGVSGGGYPEETTVGGELSLSDRPELVVRAPERSRWRLGAYSTYTGAGFERDDRGSERVTEALPTAGADRPSPQYRVLVEPKRPMSTLATVWRPAFGQADGREVSVTTERGLIVDEPVTTGETYETFTYGPPDRAVAAERSTQESYPTEIERRYTQLPDDTPDRLAERTERIAEEAGAETPFETAEAVDSWLKTNKDYSLEASHDRSNDVADEFVFEMEAGYCQYFATAMTAMLRTQGVPARYVTGYGSGERVGDEEYLVRGKNAHAWVEIYVTDIGWVTFDPTAAGGRTDAGRDEAPADDLGEEPDESPFDESSGDDLDGGSDEASEEPPEEDADDDEESEDRTDVTGSVNVTLSPDPVPGREVTVTVTRDDAPLGGATVFFNDQRIGETDGTGNVTGEVPYSQSLDVEVRSDELRTQSAGNGASGSRTLADAVTTLGEPSSGVSEAYPSADAEPRIANRNTTFSFDVPTGIGIELDGEAIAGSAVRIEATIDDQPVDDADVSLDGAAVARTDSDGGATIELPDAETAHLEIERAEAYGNRTLDLISPGAEAPVVNLSVDPSFPVAVPLSSATAEVTHEGAPVPNAVVSVDGERVGETDSNGTLGVALPLADSATVSAAATVSGEPATAETSVDGLYRNLAAVVGAALVPLAALLFFARRRGVTPAVAIRGVRRLVSGVGRVLVASIVTFGRTIEAAVGAAVRAVVRVAGLLRDGVDGAKALLAAVRRLVATIRTLPARFHPLVVLAFLKRLSRSASESVAAGRVAASDTADGRDGTGPDDGTLSVREAWNEFREYVTVRSWRTSTPGEIARWGVNRDGLPADAVETLRDAFRDVEYGGRSPKDRAPAAGAAIEEIRSSRHGDEEGDEL